MVELTTKCGTTFSVDADVAEEHGHLAWRLDKDGYVYRKTTISGKRGRSVRLHRVVLGVSDPDVYVDHKSGNKLDCTRDNLRATNRAGNARNRMKRGDLHSQFKGVTKHGRRWQARYRRGWRDAEAAHGITGATHGKPT